MQLNWQDFQNDLQSLSNRGMRRGLERMQAALDFVNNPEKKIPSVHIAGTNGKGSVCALVAQGLAKSGYRVGVTLSPHMFDFRERLQMVLPKKPNEFSLPEQDQVLEWHREFFPVAEKFELTYFEYGIFLAWKAFQERHCDIVVLETGMGGRWDATNTAPALVSGIVTVGLDHMAILGETRQEILREKMQIMKSGTFFLFGEEDPELTEIARCHARQVACDFFSFGDIKKNILEKGPSEFPKYSVTLQHNFIFAQGILDLLKKKGFQIKSTKSFEPSLLLLPPGRFQTLRKNPPIVVDGAHNEPALLKLKQHATNLWGENYDCFFGCLADRDLFRLSELIRPRNGDLFWVNFHSEDRGRDPEKLLHDARESGIDYLNLEDGSLREKVEKNLKPSLVCGSLYLVAKFIRDSS